MDSLLLFGMTMLEERVCTLVNFDWWYLQRMIQGQIMTLELLQA